LMAQHAQEVKVEKPFYHPLNQNSTSTTRWPRTRLPT
jgi:hypothetical protein